KTYIKSNNIEFGGFMKKKALIIFLLIGFPVTVSAAVNVLSRTAMLKITQADGTFVSVAPTAPLPEIRDGSIVEIPNYVAENLGADIDFDGQTLHLMSGDRIQIMTDESGSWFQV